MGRKLTMDTSIAIDIKSAASDSFKDNIKMIEIGKIKESMDNFYSLSDIEILAEDNDEPINDEDDDFNESNNNDNIVEVPLDGEIRTAEGKQEKLIKWAQTVNQDQLNFLLNSGLYNSAIKGYLMLAAEEAAFTKEQINVLLGGMMKALSNYDKAEAENKFLSI